MDRDESQLLQEMLLGNSGGGEKVNTTASPQQ